MCSLKSFCFVILFYYINQNRKHIHEHLNEATGINHIGRQRSKPKNTDNENQQNVSTHEFIFIVFV